jgi:SpoVK/Ycf46/Vps4 family AAA+-type ATPase
MTLADVAGMESVKRRLNMAFLAPLQNPDIRKLYGKSLRGGLLLYGPPGCGKTFIARATAGELGARFMAIGLTDVVDMYIGQSERNLHEIFETARRTRPCVLFFDEIDALGRRRSLLRESAGRDVVNQLLAEMDNVDSSNEGVFVLAATNHPWDVDSALRRPGRLDRTLLVLPPDAAAREAILRLHLRDRPVEGVDVKWVAGQTEGYSGADVAHLCESAAEHALEDSLDRGITRPILMSDFKRALKDVRPSVRPWFDTAKNYALFANEGGVYDELLDYLRTRKMI